MLLAAVVAAHGFMWWAATQDYSYEATESCDPGWPATPADTLLWVAILGTIGFGIWTLWLWRDGRPQKVFAVWAVLTTVTALLVVPFFLAVANTHLFETKCD